MVFRRETNPMVAAVSLVFVLAITGLFVMALRVVGESERRTDRLIAIDTIELVVFGDELATSALNLVPELRDEGSIEAIREDVDEEIELVETLLRQLDIDPTLAGTLDDILGNLQEAIDDEVDAVDPSVAIEWSVELRTAVREVLASVSPWYSPELATARAAAVAHQHSILASILGGDGVTDTAAELSITAAAAAAVVDAAHFDPDVEIASYTDAGVADDALDEVGDLIITFSAAAESEAVAANIASSMLGLLAFVALAMIATTLGVVMIVGSDRKGSETIRELTHAAHHDPLTGLCNRAHLERIARKIRPARNEQVGLLFVDLDGFKEINDRHGHHVGDEVLKIVADRLRAAVRSEDVIARIGGDEFVVLLPSVDDPSDIVAIGDRVVAGVREPSIIEGEAIVVGASVGAAVELSQSFDLTSMLRDADAALLAAKDRGKGQVVTTQTLTHELVEAGS